MTAPPEQYVVPVPQISFVQGLGRFVRLSDIYVWPGVDMFEVDCLTDYYCKLALHWERTNPPANPGLPPLEGLVEDPGPLLEHRLRVPDGAIAQQPRQQMPQEVRFEIRLSETDSSVDAQGERRELRPYIGTCKLRQVPWNFVPVRFYNYGDTPPPPPGGDEGDWNQYAWAQYNPNGQPFTHIPYASFDLRATNGTETFPVCRLFSRYIQPTGSKIAIKFDAEAPDMAEKIPMIADPLGSAMLEVYFDGTLTERFCWSETQPGELEPVERLIRVTASSSLIRCARLIGNPGPEPTFMGPNYWLISQGQTNLVAPP